MSKISQYLNEHISGEAVASVPMLEKYSVSESVLRLKPELVVFPKTTSDIRKIAKFTWQLAGKGHILPITVRGGGGDPSGGSIGSGIIVDTSKYFNQIIYIAPKGKDRFVHVQAGTNTSSLDTALKFQGLTIPALQVSQKGTVGGVAATNSTGPLSGKYGPISDWVGRLEVVLANGEVIETGRISKRELENKKGLQTLEGDIYRQLDGLIEDNADMIESLSQQAADNTGYASITKVKEKNGSFDLTPLLIGAQGTLGIISELVIKADFYNMSESVLVARFHELAPARDAADLLIKFEPASIDVIDGELFKLAAKDYGKKYALFGETQPGAVVVVRFNEFSEHARRKRIKKISKLLTEKSADLFSSLDENIDKDDLESIANVEEAIRYPEAKGVTRPSLIDGASIPVERREDFLDGLNKLANKHHVDLFTHIKWLDSTVYTRPSLELSKVADKQKLFKLISDYAELVADHDGILLADGAEGRLKATAYYSQIDQSLIDLYEQIRLIFDPLKTLNPGVKQASDLRTLVRMLNTDFS